MNTTPLGTQTEETAQPYSLQIGDRTHRVIAAVLTQGVTGDRTGRVMQVLAATSNVLATHPVQHQRARAANIEVSTAAACYVHRFLMDPNWTFEGAEQPVGDGRADLLFRHRIDGRRLIDEVKTSRGRADETALRDQIDRYLTGGRDRWGDLFVGVRLCAVAQPRRSRLYRPSVRYAVALADTDLAGGVA